MSKIKSIPAWVWRKALYGVVFLVSGILGYFGILSQIQADQVMEQVDKWLPILASMIGSGTAFIKTHQGSDSTATGEDRDTSGADEVLDRLAGIPGAVLAAIRAEERGEHDTVTVTDAAAAAASAQSARANAASALRSAAPGADTKSVAAYYRGRQ